MKIVITGSLGHIGSRLIRDIPLAFPGAELIMVDNMMTQRYASLFHLPEQGIYRFIEGDVLTADLDRLMKGAEVVLHLAAITDAANSFNNREQVEHVNFNATVRVAEACRTSGVAMIHLSSTSVYGTQNEVVDEECPATDLQPQSPYAVTKLKEEDYLKNLASTGGLRFVICRFGTIAGISPGMRFHTAVNKFCWQAVMGQPLTVWRTALHQKRPYLALDDASRAVMFIINNALYDREVYNVLTENLTVNDIIQSIRKRVSKIEIQYVDTAIMNQLSYEVSNARFRSRGFALSGSIDACVGDTIGLIGRAGGDRVR